mmetsp:Transcript_10377/g.30468  ORF Transcript_10377/g.30468 Transcript_10377/m.30468 type:complete len:201 (+) Transcript_10377:516-1118(+)
MASARGIRLSRGTSWPVTVVGWPLSPGDSRTRPRTSCGLCNATSIAALPPSDRPASTHCSMPRARSASAASSWLQWSALGASLAPWPRNSSSTTGLPVGSTAGIWWAHMLLSRDVPCRNTMGTPATSALLPGCVLLHASREPSGRSTKPRGGRGCSSALSGGSPLSGSEARTTWHERTCVLAAMSRCHDSGHAARGQGAG